MGILIMEALIVLKSTKSFMEAQNSDIIVFWILDTWYKSTVLLSEEIFVLNSQFDI